MITYSSKVDFDYLNNFDFNYSKESSNKLWNSIYFESLNVKGFYYSLNKYPTSN